MREVYVGLGSNLGDRAANLWEAVRLMSDLSDSTVHKVSRLYESAPVGPQGQPWFANAVIELGTSSSPRELLGAAKRTESEMGREKTERWGPRLIDIDLLLYGDEEIRELDLVVPHRELMNRRFVLVPLIELLPDGPLRDRMQEREAALRSAQPMRAWPGGDSRIVPSTPNDA